MSYYNGYFSKSPFEQENERDRQMVIFEDFIYGFAIGQVTMFAVGIWSLLIGLVTGVLWVLGGIGFLGYNTWRRIGIPLILSLTFAITKHHWIPLLNFPLMWGAFSLGYGTHSTQPPDPGSWLGRIFGKYTRLVWFGILGLTLIPLFL